VLPNTVYDFDSTENGLIPEVGDVKFQTGVQNHTENTSEIYGFKLYKLFFLEFKM